MSQSPRGTNAEEGDGASDTNMNPNINTNGSPQLSESVVKAIFLLLGVGILIPWNAFVSAKPYFQARLCSDEGNVIIDFELWFGFIWNLSSVLSLGLIIATQTILRDHCKKQQQQQPPQTSNTLVSVSSDSPSSGTPLNPNPESNQNHDPNHDHCSSSDESEGHSFWLVMVPLALYLTLFILTDLLVLVPNIPPTTFLSLTLVGLAICGTCGAIATAGIVSTAALFDSHVGINPFFSGQALGGLVVSVANFVTASLESPSSFWEQNCQDDVDDDTMRIALLRSRRELEYGEQHPTCSPYSEYDWAVFAYFFAGCVVLACCLVGYTTIHKYQQSEHRDDYEPVVQYTSNNLSAAAEVGLLLDEQSPRFALEITSDSYHDEYPVISTDHQQQQPIDPPADPALLHNPTGKEVIPAIANAAAAAAADVEEYTEEENEVAVFSAIKGPVSCVYLTFAVTLCLFPSWVSQLRSTHECESSHFRMSNDLYVPFSFVVFNLGDLCGRVLSAKIPVERIRHMSLKLVIAAVCRFLFFPLFLFCVAGDAAEGLTSSSSSSRMVIESDVYSLAVQFFFAFTNGILISCSFMHAPHLVTGSMQERASEMMTFAVSFGLLSGSLLSFQFSELAARL
jgi:hypothetical protein